MSHDFQGQNKFKFILSGERFMNSKFELLVTDIAVPGVNIGVSEQPTSIKTLHRVGNKIDYDDLGISFLLDENLEAWIEMFKWVKDMKSTRTGVERPLYADASIIILDNKFRESFSIKFEMLFPTSITPISLTTRNTDSEVIDCTVNFKYNQMDIDVLSKNFKLN